MARRNSIYVLLVVFMVMTVLMACDDRLANYEEYVLSDGWSHKDTVAFDITPPDTIHRYDLFLHLRNDLSYDYANLWLIAQLQHPEGKVVTDTLEYAMTEPDGTFLGKKRGDLIENKLWYRDSLRFRESGTYQLTIRQAMRRKGSANQITDLGGVIDVAYSLEKTLNNGND
jgi:gliding motility-associated lipoprotein GldH